MPSVAKAFGDKEARSNGTRKAFFENEARFPFCVDEKIFFALLCGASNLARFSC